MFRTKTPKDALIHRLKITRGHLDKVMKMIDEDAYCVDILTQSKAIQNALHQVDVMILEQHLSSCVVEHIKQGRTKKAVEEIMMIFRKR